MALFTQFNPHGLFIVAEEIGFIVMILSLFCLIPVFSSDNLLEKSIKWTLRMGLLLCGLSFTVISLIYGIQREYRFEVVVISIAWIELILSGILFAGYFRKLAFENS